MAHDSSRPRDLGRREGELTLADAGGQVTARGAGALLEVEAAAAAIDAELKRVLM